MNRLFVRGDRVEVTVPIDHATWALQAPEMLVKEPEGKS